VRLGLLTACLPQVSLDELAGWAGAHGYRGLEVAAWPRKAAQASHIDAGTLDDAEARRLRGLFDDHGLGLAALAYYENNLHVDRVERQHVHDHLRRVIDAASTLGCDLVGTFVGRDVSLSVADNLRLAEDVFPALVEHAKQCGVRLVVENCPMEGWHPDGYPANLAYSPELWDWLSALDLYLNFDPSHLVWLGIDPVEVLRPHADRVLLVQAKDVQVDASARNRFGFYGQVVDRAPWTSGWWRYRVPGLGQVDWRRLVDLLYEVGYDGYLSVEHEDPVWDGSPERVRQGLVLAERHLARLIVN
jgi:sugar phosphate isomerase/epimerase